MKLSKEQFCNAINTYAQMREEEDTILNFLSINPEWIGAQWIDNYYYLLSELCELTPNRFIGTELDWFCYDTNFGKDFSTNKIFVEDKTYTIDTPEKLYDYIMKGEV